MTTVEDIANEALRDIGYRKRIGNIFDGSEASKAVLEIYGQTRDETLRSQDWPFARRANIPLQLLKGPPPPGGYNPAQPWSDLYPPPGWLFEYAYPSDALEIRGLMPTPGLWPDRDPRPALFSVENDNTIGIGPGSEVLLLETGEPLLLNDGSFILLNGQSGSLSPSAGLRVVLSNIYQAVAVYRARVVDPSTWDVLFTATLIKRLAAKLAVPLGRDLNLMKAEEQQVDPIANIAERHRG